MYVEYLMEDAFSRAGRWLLLIQKPPRLHPPRTESSVTAVMETMAVLAMTAPPLAGTRRTSSAVRPLASLSFTAVSTGPRARLGLSAAGAGRAAPLRVVASSSVGLLL
jgi:hypothetical protein